jgi:hypothetical protein
LGSLLSEGNQDEIPDKDLMRIGGLENSGQDFIACPSEAALIGCGILLGTALRFFRMDMRRQQMSERGALMRYVLVA